MSNKRRVTPVNQYSEFEQFGVYVWQMPDGKVVGDDQRNFLSIQAKFGDLKRISELTSAVRALGIREGSPLFLSGHRKVSDEEYENQQERLKSGLIPDDHDLPAILEDIVEHDAATRRK